MNLPALADPAVAVRSAFRAGRALGVLVRPSRRSPSGAVLVVVFGDLARAAAFARRWSARLGVACVLRPRRRPGRPLSFAVSLPVAGAVPFSGVPALARAAGKPVSAWPLAGVPSVAVVARAARVALL